MHLNIQWGNMLNLIYQIYSNNTYGINTKSPYNSKVCSSNVNSESEKAVTLAHTPVHSPHPGEQTRPALQHEHFIV